jgi:hypothetical protein
MRLLGNIPCGCDARDEIIFKAGNVSWVEGAILAAAIAAVLTAFALNRGTSA